MSWDSDALRIPATAYAQTLAISFLGTMKYIIIVICFLFSCDTADKKKLYAEDFNDLSETEKKILHFDTLDGDFMKYEGELRDSGKIEFVLDRPNRFAIRRIINKNELEKETEIACSGRWSILGEDALLLRFYFVPKNFFNVLDSTTNSGNAKMLLYNMAGFNPQLDTLWIYGVPCVKAKTDR